MTPLKIFGVAILVLAWGWLSWGVLASGVNLKNLLIVIMSAIIIFVPLYKKNFMHQNKDNKR